MATKTAPRGKRGGPAIRTTDDMMDYWGERITARAPEREDREKSSIIMRGDTLYHYGTHFPLATIIRHANGRARIVLLNGDEWRGGTGFGSSTWQRQSQARSIVQREIEGTNILSITLPFSALDAAGIVQESIRPLELTDERWELKEYVADEAPGPLLKMDDPSGATYAHTEQRHGWVHRETGEVFDVYSDGVYRAPDRELYDWREYTYVEERTVKVDDPNRANVENEPQHEWPEGAAELQSDGKWHWETRRHWLGDSLFKATVSEWRDERAPDGELLSSERVERTAKFLSSFDYNEPRPLYFLCELPRTSATTIAAAYEALKSKDVVRAEANGIEVLRQGDVFAIPTNATTNELKLRAIPHRERFWNEELETFDTRPVTIRSRQKHGAAADVLKTNHRPTHLIVLKNGDHYGRGFMYHDPTGWGREPDHRRLKLGDGKRWYRLVKNAVPESSSRVSGRVGLNQSGQSRAWTLGGSVD